MKIFRKGIVAIVILLVGIYLFGLCYYKDKYLPGTTINGEQVGGFSHESVKHKFDVATINKVTVKIPSGEIDEIGAEEIGFKNKTELPLNKKLKVIDWPKSLFTPEKLETITSTEYSEELLEKRIKNSIFIKDKKSPQDARVEIHGNKVEIIPEVHDYLAKPEPFKKSVIDAFKKDIKNIELTEFEEPKLTTESKEIKNEFKKQNDFLNLEISIIGYNKTKDIKIKDIYNNKLSKDLLAKIIKDFSKELDTINLDREWKTQDGYDIVIPSGTYGWQVDRDKTINNILSEISKGNYKGKEVKYKVYGYNKQDIGNTYIEVNLSKQTLYFIKNGELVLTAPVVTGAVPGAHTPTGVHSIKGKTPNRYLKGSNRITKIKYSSFVNYWMPIDYTGIGLHDASWQGGNFSPTKYLNGYGSNGCINMSYENAKYIYNNADINTPVLVYETTTNHSDVPYY